MVRGHCQCVGPHTPSTPTKSMVKVSSGFSSLITYSLFSPQAHRRPMHALDGHKHAPSSVTSTRPRRPQERALVGHKNMHSSATRTSCLSTRLSFQRRTPAPKQFTLPFVCLKLT